MDDATAEKIARNNALFREANDLHVRWTR